MVHKHSFSEGYIGESHYARLVEFLHIFKSWIRKETFYQTEETTKNKSLHIQQNIEVFKKCAIDPWTTHVWTVGVHLLEDFFVVNEYWEYFMIHSWLSLKMQNLGYRRWIVNVILNCVGGLAPLNSELFKISCSSSFLEFYISRIIQYGLLVIWLL